MEIVATFVPGSPRREAEDLRHPPEGATAVELRADLLGNEPNLAPLVAASPLPVVVTLRSHAEGGERPDDPPTRRRFFQKTASLPVALFDLESGRDRELVGSVIPRERVILSAHFSGGVSPEVERQAEAMLSVGTRFIKVVPRATSASGFSGSWFRTR